MLKNTDLETRIVILEAALAWIRHESRARRADPRAMARIAAIAEQLLEDEAPRAPQRTTHPNESRASGSGVVDVQLIAPLG